MKLFRFDHEPTFAELWDACVYLIYGGAEPLARDLEDLFHRLGITKDSKIADVAAGAGFPALALAKDGIKLTCSDGAEDEVGLFNQRARESGLDVTCEQLLWKDLPTRFAKDSFDFLFCRGNSFIYAAGGWNEAHPVHSEESLRQYRGALAAFYAVLKPGAWFYTDKFQDTETSSRETVAQIQVTEGRPEKLVFWRERIPEKKMRQASMIRETEAGEKSTPNITYDLSGPELEEMMQEVGFRNIQKIQIPSESHFDVWIAQK